MGHVHRRNRPKPWEARVFIDGRWATKSFARKVDAERWVIEQEAKILRGEWIDPRAGDITLREWVANEWLPGLDIKPSTRANYESNLKSRILPVFGNTPIAKITPALVRRWQMGMQEKGLSAASIVQARRVLSAALEVAVNDGRIPRNPIRQVKAPTVRPRRQRYLTAEQVRLLADACGKRLEGARNLVLVMAWAGLRWGEVVALRWRNVDLKRGRLNINEAVTEVGGRLIWGTPKTHEVRSVPVPRFALEGLKKGNPDQLVFTAPRGGVLRNANFRKTVWDPAVEELDLGDLTPHDLRDTAASLMISSGATIKAVQRALGHSSAAMTLDVYGGLFEEDLDTLQDRMEERFAGVAVQGADQETDEGDE